MALGTPVICLDWAGPGLIVNEESGYTVTPNGRDLTISLLAGALNDCYQDKLNGTIKGAKAAVRAREVFSWSSLAQRIGDAYRRVVKDAK